VSTDLSWTQSAPPLSVPPLGGPGDTLPPAPVAPPVASLPAAPTAPPAVAPLAAARTAYVVFARLESGDRVEVASHGDEASARNEATALMRYLRDGRGDWPYLAGRFVRPEAIVSIDVDAVRD